MIPIKIIQQKFELDWQRIKQLYFTDSFSFLFWNSLNNTRPCFSGLTGAGIDSDNTNEYI